MIRTLTLSLALLPCLALATWAEPVTISHAQGETVLDAPPQTVMVTDWAAFDLLTTLGVPVAGVPAGTVPPHLADRLTEDMQRIGSLQEPDIEGIAAASPDLVVVAARSRTSYPVLSGIVPTIDLSVDNAALIEGTKANLMTLASAFGREAQAETLIAALDAKIDAAKAAAKDKGDALVVVVNGARLGIYGPQSRVSWIYTTLGVPSVYDTVDDRDHGGDGITFEYLRETNPDWLFVVDRDAGVGTSQGAAQALLDNELIHQTDFWKNDRVVYLDPAASYVTMNGYDALMLLLDQVTEAYQTR